MGASKTISVFIVLWVIIVLTGKINGTNFHCSRHCKDDKNIYGYQIGKTYNYKYSGDISSFINSTNNGQTKDESRMKISCSVQLHVVSTCDLILKIYDVAMEQYHIQNTIITKIPMGDDFKELKMQLTEFDTPFSFQNGKIETLCPHEEENTSILNIKRGILSAFQNNIQNFQDTLVYETDISGTCETYYKVLNESSEGITIEKSKRLDACSHRMSQYLSWQSVPYSTNAKSLPLLRSSLSCKQTYQEGILDSSDCVENYLFQPFSHADNGAMTLISQQLNYLQESIHFEPNVPLKIRRTSLLYEANEKPSQEINIEKTAALFTQLETKSSDGVDGDVPVLFSRLVFDMQNLNTQELLRLFDKLNKKQRKIYIDAISVITTNSGIEIMKELFINNKVNKNEMDSWIISLGFIKTPNLETIKAIQALLSTSATKEKLILAASSVIHRYCTIDKRCLQSNSIVETLKEIEKPLQNNCIPSGSKNNDEILLALKGIGNAGITTSLNLLKKCYRNPDLIKEIRLAAIAAHRRFSCLDNFNLDDFKNYFSNRYEDTEIRIASYLSMIQCGSYAVMSQIKDVLLKEETNQVGSFVWTHLTNLQETSVQWKQGLRKLMENEFLKNKFNTDIRKYSRNYEASAFFDSIGAGASVESNVIFTSESYLPKSAMFNFTVDLFGETVNVLEVGGRFDGFEDIIENLFGPEGYFSDKSIQTYLTNTRNAHSENYDRIKELGDDFRSNKILSKDPKGLLYAKIFGNEFGYMNFKNFEELMGNQITAKNAMAVLLNFLRENDVDYNKNFMFLDSSYEIPTGLGFPLKMVANGTASVGLTVKGKIDLQDVWSYKFALEGKVYPSASMQIVGSMSVDALVVSSGVTYVGNMNSNTYIDGHVLINAGKLVDLKVNVPKKQMDVFSASSNIFINHNRNTFRIRDLSNNLESNEHCTQELFSKVTGLEVCSNLKYVNASLVETAPYFPLTGEFRYSLHVKKTDDFDSFQLHVKTETQTQTYRPLYAMTLYLDTPNSIIDRRIKASYRVDLEKFLLTANFISPFANFEVSSNIGNEFNKYSFNLQTLFNNKEIISLHSSFKINNTEESLKYDSLAKLKFQQKQIAAVSGSLSFMQKGQYTADLKLEGVSNEPINILGEMAFDPTFVNIQTTMTSRKFNGKLHAKLQTNHDGVILTSKLIYSTPNVIDESFSFLAQLIKHRKSLVFEDKILVKFESTQLPIYNLYLDFNNKRSHYSVENYGIVTFFGTTWKTEQIGKFLRNKDSTDIDFHAYLNCDKNDIDYRALLLYNTSTSHAHLHALAQLNTDQRVEGRVNYNQIDLLQKIDGLIYYPKQTWNFNGTVEQILFGNYYFNFHGQHIADKVETPLISIYGDYVNSSMEGIQNHKINSSLHLHGSSGLWETPWIFTTSLQTSNDLFLTFSQLRTKYDVYVNNISWMKDTFSFVVQANDKRLIVINGVNTEKIMNFMLGLNIFQHFELSVQLLLPLENFELKFHWDKDRDENKKLLFGVSKNTFKGLYNMDIEYPNQKIAAAFILLPTQVTMNVTWGIEISQKIYLKVGNKIYDVGGIWFGEMETPFQYLEKQHFQLKYFVLSNSFEIQSDLFWRNHSINLALYGSRSSEHISGYLQLNTTLPEISKIGAAVSHTHQVDNNYKTDATFQYNEHQILAQSNWKLTGLIIDSNFNIESPTNTIQPILGILNVNTKHTTSFLFKLLWQEKNLIIISSNIKSDASNVIIYTPFENFEETIFEYSVKASKDSVSLAVTVKLLKQFNNLDLKWTNVNKFMEFWMDLTSPVTGYYSVHFTHSTVLGVLKESFTIKGHQFRDLVLFSLEGHIIPILDANVTATMKLLEHKASLAIENKRVPTSSLVKVIWDDFNIESKMFVNFVQDKINQFNWVVSSNIFKENMELKYFGESDKYVFKVYFPINFRIHNVLFVGDNYKLLENDFGLKASDLSVDFNYKHNASNLEFNQYFSTKFDNQSLEYYLVYSNRADPFLEMKFSAPYNIGSSDMKNVTVFMRTGMDKSKVTFVLDRFNYYPFSVNGVFDYSKIDDNVQFSIKTSDSELNIIGEIVVKLPKARFNFKSVTVGDYFWDVLNSELKSDYIFDDGLIILKVDFSILEKEWFYLDTYFSRKDRVEVMVVLNKNNDELVSLKGKFLDNLVDVGLNIGKDKDFVLTYYLGNADDKFSSKLNVLSKLNFMNDSSIEVSFSKFPNNKFILIDLNIYKYIIHLKSNVTLNYLLSGDLIRTNINSSLLAKFVNREEPKNDFNVNINFDSKLEANPQIGELVVNYESSIPSLKTVKINSNYNINDSGFDTDLKLVYNDLMHKVALNHVANIDTFEIVLVLDIPQIDINELGIYNLRKYNDYTTQIFLKTQSQRCSMDIITTYLSLTDFNTKFQINLPENEKYSGTGLINFGNDIKAINFSFIFPHGNKNSISLDWKINQPNQLNQASFGIELFSFHIQPQLLNLKYKLSDDKKLFLAYYYDSETLLYNSTAEMTNDKLNLRVDSKETKDILVIGGSHKFNGILDFSVSYGVIQRDVRFKFEVLNHFGSSYQTKLDISSNLRGWSRFTIESKIDKNKIRISFNIRNIFMSIIAKKFSAEGNEILSVMYQGETLLEIASSSEQMTLRTSSRFGVYRLFVQCTRFPGIYAFSILKGGENLISLMLQNLSSHSSINFKGKLIAPDLLPKYSNVSLHLLADKNISKNLKFQIYNSQNQLFDLQWNIKKIKNEYLGNFKLESDLNFLQLFEISSSLNTNEDIIIDTRVNLKMFNNKQDNYYANIILPNKNFNSKLSFKHENHILYFNIKPRFIEFQSLLPIHENLKNLTFKTNLDFNHGGVQGKFVMSKDEQFFESDWDLSCNNNNNSADFNFNLRNNMDSDTYLLTPLMFKARYYYYKSINIDYDLEYAKGFMQGELISSNLEKGIKLASKEFPSSSSYNLLLVVKEKEAQFNIKHNNKDLIELFYDKNFTPTALFIAKVNFLINLEAMLKIKLEDNEKVLIECKLGIQESFILEELEFDLTAELLTNLSNGSVNIIVNNSAVNETNLIKWSSNYDENGFGVRINFTQNNYVVQFIASNDINDKNLNANLKFSCGDKILQLVLLGNILAVDEIEGSLELTTPLDILNILKARALIKHREDYYSIDNLISWPENQMISFSARADLLQKRKDFSAGLNSSFAQPIHARLIYSDVVNEKVINFNSAAGEEFIDLNMNFAAGMYFIANLSSSLEGFKSSNLTFVAEYSANFLIQQLKLGHPKTQSEPNDKSFKALIIFDHNEIHMNFTLDNNVFNAKFVSSYEYAKEINLKGYYSNNVDAYSLVSDGNWNELNLRVFGSLEIREDFIEMNITGDTNEEYSGQVYFLSKKSGIGRNLEFDAYFPKKIYSTYLKMDVLENEASLLLKTPFSIVNSINLKSEFKANEGFKVDLIGKVFDDKNFATHILGKVTRDNFQSVLDLSLPFSGDKWSVYINAQNNGGIIKVLQNNTSQFNNLSLNYVLEEGKFVSKFDFMSNRYNINKTLEVLFKNSPEIVYGVIFDDYKVVSVITILDENIKITGNAKFPCFNIKSAGFYIDHIPLYTKKQNDFLINLYYNEYYINSTVFINKNKLLKLYSKCNLPHETSGEIDNKITLQKTPYGFELDHSITSGKSGFLNTSIVINNTPTGFELESISRFGQFNYTINLIIHKNLDKVYIINDEHFVLKYKNIDESTLAVSIGEKHKINIKVTNNNFDININSSLIDKNHLQITIDLIEQTTRGISLNIIHINQKLYQALISYDFTNDNKIYKANASLKKLHKQIIDFNFDFKSQPNILLNSNLLIYNKNHAISFLLNTNNCFHTKLNLSSPFIQKTEITIELDSPDLQEINLLIKSGPLSENNFIKFESYIKNTIIRTKIESPNLNYLKLFNLSLIWDFRDKNIYENKLEIKSEQIGNILIQADFKLQDELLDIETHLRVPFLEKFDTFDGKIYVPIKFRPEIKFIFPNNQVYAFNFDHRINSTDVFINTTLIILEETTQIYLDLKLVPIEIDIFVSHPSVLPFNDLNISTKNKSISIKYDKRVLGVFYDYHYDNQELLLFLQIITHYRNYQDLLLDIHYKTDDVKILKFILIPPTIKNKLGFDTSSNFTNLATFNIKCNIYAPNVIHGIDFLETNFATNLDINSSKILYSLRLLAKNNLYNFLLNLITIDRYNYKQFFLNTKINTQELLTNLELQANTLADLKLTINLITPLESIQNFDCIFSTLTDVKRLKHHDSLNVTFNNASIIDANLNMGPKKWSLLLYNIWKPISIDYALNREYILAAICWDLNHLEKSRIGFEIQSKDTTTATIFIPNITLKFKKFNHKNTTDEIDYIEATYNNHTIILSSTLQNTTQENYIHINSEISLRFPFRTFKLKQITRASLYQTPEMVSDLILIWGNEETSKLTFTQQILPGKLISQLKTPALKNDIILKIDMLKLNTIPSSFKAELQYSDNPEKLLYFEMYYNNYCGDFFSTERYFFVRHPASKINFELYFSTLRQQDFSNGSVVLKYKNYETSAIETIRTSVKVDHTKFGVFGEVVTHKNSFNFKAASTSGDSSLGFVIKAKVNEKDPINLEYTYIYKEISPSLNFIASYGDSRKYIFYAGLPNEREILANMGHNLYGKYSLDSLITMKLNTSQLLWIKMIWKKQIYTQFHKAIFEEYNDLRYVIEATGKELIDVINDDIGKQFIIDTFEIKERVINFTRKEQIELLRDFQSNSPVCSENMKYVCDYLDNPSVRQILDGIAKPLKEYFEVIKTSFAKTWNTIYQSTQDSATAVAKQFRKTLRDIQNIKVIKINAKDILKTGISDARKSLKQMETIAVELLDDFDNYVNNLKNQVEEFFDPFLNLLDDFVAYIEQRLAILQIAVLDIMDTVQRYIYNLRETKEMLRVYALYINWLEELHITDFLEPIGDVLEDILETVITDLKRITEHYKPYLDALAEVIFGKYDKLKQLPLISELREFVNRIYQKTIWIWHYQNMTESLKNCIHRLSNDIGDLLSFIDLDDKNRDFENPFGQTDYIIRPEFGLIEISQPLPVEWEAFNKAPAFEQHPLYHKIHRKTDQFIKFYKNRYDLIDGLEHLLEELSEPTIVPPIYNSAMVIGETNFATFNGGFYDFSSNCTYLLASDFKTNSFSLLIHFEDSGNGLKRSFEILSGNSSLIITPEYKILLNKEKVEFPLIFNHFTVIRDESSVVIDSVHALKLRCNINYHFCTIQLSGWMFGKTGGLLGTLENEEIPSANTLSNGTQTKSLAEFLESWKIQNNCVVNDYKGLNRNSTLSPVLSDIMSNLCKLFFQNDNSPLSQCFASIPPTPFLDICNKDLRSSNSKPSICPSIAAYRSRCRKQNIIVDMPELCVECSNDLTQKDKIFDGHNPRSTDVIFVTQLECFDQNWTLSLPQFLNRSLKKHGFHNNLFASIGYGGNSFVKPQVYTTDGSIWNDETLKITYQTDKVAWKNKKHSNIEAINYASNLNFRAGVPKLLILSQCDEVADLENSPQMYNMLGEKDITLHVLKPEPFSNFSKIVEGINNYGGIVSKATDGISSEQVVDVINDVFSGLALSTNGTVFDINSVFSSVKSASLWSDLVTENIKQSPCQKCKCVPDKDGVGKTVCRRCLAPAVKQFLNEYELGHKMKFVDSLGLEST